MSINNQKLQSMLYGAFYGDAYSLGAHWIYDTTQIENASLVLDGCNKPLSSYHCTKDKGDFTHYGDQMLWLLEDIVKENKFSLIDFGNTWYKNMKNYTGYIDGASKHTLSKLDEEKNYFACGSSSSDLSAVSRIFPIIFKYHDSLDDMKEAIKLHIILTHMNKDLILAGAFFAEVAISVLHGVSLKETIYESSKYFGEDILQWTKDATSLLDLSPQEAISKLGQSCSVDGAFASTIYILLKYENNFIDALKYNMLCGGDSSARGMIIGGILGAIHHETVLNYDSIKQINTYKKIENLLKDL